MCLGTATGAACAIDVFRSHLDVRGQVPVIVVEDLFAEPRQLDSRSAAGSD